MMIYVNELMDVCKIVAFLHPTLMIFKIIFFGDYSAFSAYSPPGGAI